ncbi:MAG: dockerin type I repeat-containing protein [Clostridiales Family XIII bacterium]|jgi:hypothetical protein|nr:dockerin type I repeat-containing protein [Clostridiales Family XIII bacterium]
MDGIKLSRSNMLRILFALLLSLCITATPIMMALSANGVVYGAEVATAEAVGESEDTDDVEEVALLGSDDYVIGTPAILIAESITIDQGGTYRLDSSLTGASLTTITIATTDPVTILGYGIGDGDINNTENIVNKKIKIVGSVPGINLTIQDLFINNPAGTNENILDVIGADNTLTIAGSNLLEIVYGGGGSKAMVHVPGTANLTVNGTGTLYFYKDSGGAGFGGNSGEINGALTFDGSTIFGKGTRQGAVIGTGSNAPTNTPAEIRFISGEYTMINNATGALIGGSGGNGGGLGGNVYIEGGLFNFNTDWSGAAIGGGGYSGGDNTSIGGNVFITGGSLRSYIDVNAVFTDDDAFNNHTANGPWGVSDFGVNDAAITASKVNDLGDYVYLLKFDTTDYAASLYTVAIDDEVYYEGGTHNYRFINEDLIKSAQVAVVNTLSNWVSNADPNLYLYATGQDHVLDVNGTTFDAVWDSTTSSFTVTPATAGPTDPTLWDGTTYDTSWYNTTDAEFTLTTAAQFAGFAQIVNNKPEASEAGAVVGTNPSIPADDFLGKTVKLAADLDLGGVEEIAAAMDNSTTPATWTNPVWSGAEWAPIGYYSSSGMHTSSGSENGLYGRPFKGTFDGQFHEISNLYVPYYGTSDDNAAGNSHGLFGDLGPAGTVKNIVVKSGVIKGARFNGAIVGRNWGTVENVTSYATVYGNGRGGAGGITGVNYDNGPDPYVINALSYGLVYNSKNATAGTPSAGGITSTNEGYIINSLFVGKVGTGGITNYGGITTAGTGATLIVNDYYLDNSRLPLVTTGVGGITKTLAEIQSFDFVTALNGTGNAFVADYDDNNDGYPVLLGYAEAKGWTTAAPYTPYAWYDPAATSYEIGTAAELAEFAEIVNGTAAGIAQDNFAGKTVTLTGDIALDADGKYTATPNVRYGSAGYAIITTQYAADADAAIWTPIGSGTATNNNTYSGNTFAGTFDGAGYTVSGIYTTATAPVQGLFGIVSGTVKNVTVDGLIIGKFLVGGVAAVLNGGTIENSVNNAVIFADGGTTPNGYVENGVSQVGAIGGIAGAAIGTVLITDSTNNGTVICANTNKGGRAGGILGLVNGATDAVTVTNSINTAVIDAYQYAGGIIGGTWSSNSVISYSANLGASVTGHSSGSTYVGGIAAYLNGTIESCYNKADYRIIIDGSTGDKAAHFGGIISDAGTAGKIKNSYNLGAAVYGGGATSSSSVSGINAAGGAVTNSYTIGTTSSGNVKTAEDMQKTAFVVLLNNGGESYHQDSDAINGGYPVLSWQGGTVPVGAPGSGDIDGDGYVTAYEAVLLARYVTGLETLTPEQIAAADMDGDGFLTIMDAVLLLRKVAGL